MTTTHDSSVDSVVVHFRYRGGDYQLEVDASTAQRLADAEESFPSEPQQHGRRLEHLLSRHRDRTA